MIYDKANFIRGKKQLFLKSDSEIIYIIMIIWDWTIDVYHTASYVILNAVGVYLSLQVPRLLHYDLVVIGGTPLKKTS